MPPHSLILPLIIYVQSSETPHFAGLIIMSSFQQQFYDTWIPQQSKDSIEDQTVYSSHQDIPHTATTINLRVWLPHFFKGSALKHVVT